MILFTLLASSDDVMAPQQSTLGGSPTTVIESGRTAFPVAASLSGLHDDAAPALVSTDGDAVQALTDAVAAATVGSQPQSPIKSDDEAQADGATTEEPQGTVDENDATTVEVVPEENETVTDPNAGTTTTDNNNDVAPDESAEVPANDPEASTSGSNHNDEDAAANSSDSDSDPVISALKAVVAADDAVEQADKDALESARELRKAKRLEAKAHAALLAAQLAAAE